MSQTRTQNAPQQQTAQAAPAQAIAKLQPSRLPIVGSIAKDFDVSADQWRVLVDQIFPAALTVEAIGMALAYCRARNLDVFKKPVHIVPMYSTALKKMVETVWPGIAEIRTTAARTGLYAGIEEPVLGPMVDRVFEHQYYDDRTGEPGNKVTKKVTYPEWASTKVYRLVGGQPRAFHAKVWWTESYATMGKTDVPNDMWARRSIGQLLKVLEAAALRMAFPEEIGGTYAAEEMEGRTIDGDIPGAVVPDAPRIQQRPTPPEPPADDEPEDKPEPKTIEGKALQKTDQPEGGENEVEGSTPGDDESPADFLTRLDEELAIAGDKATLLEIWEREDPATILDGTPFAEDADKIYARHESRVTKMELEAAGQGGFSFGGDDDTFPGDRQ